MGRSGRRQAAALDQPRLLEPFEPLGQRVGADSGQVDANVAEPFWTEHKLAHDEQGPALADQVERMGGSAGVVVTAARTTVPRLSYFC